MKFKNYPKKSLLPNYQSVSDFRLYDSIKNIGLLKPLVYTKNSDTQKIELYGGGGTRVRLLATVQGERQKSGLDPFQVHIVVRKESMSTEEISLSHLIQNHTHGRRKFIDKALHLNDCIETKEEELERKMSQRETVNWLRKSGLPISQSLVNDMQFTARRLYPLLPQALDNGMGRRLIVRVRKLYRDMQEIWSSFGDDQSDCVEAFEDTCEECDAEILDIKQFQEILVREICLWCGLKSQHIQALLQVDGVERARLIKTIARPDSKPVDPIRSTSNPPKPKATSKLSRLTTSELVPVMSSLSPAVVNRRKRFARRLAMELAGSADLLKCVSGSLSNAIGYSVPYPSITTNPRQMSIWQFLHICQQAVASNSEMNQRIYNDWRQLSREEFENVRALIEVTRSLGVARRASTAPLPQLQQVA